MPDDCPVPNIAHGSVNSTSSNTVNGTSLLITCDHNYEITGKILSLQHYLENKFWIVITQSYNHFQSIAGFNYRFDDESWLMMYAHLSFRSCDTTLRWSYFRSPEYFMCARKLDNSPSLSVDLLWSTKSHWSPKAL